MKLAEMQGRAWDNATQVDIHVVVSLDDVDEMFRECFEPEGGARLLLSDRKAVMRKVRAKLEARIENVAEDALRLAIEENVRPPLARKRKTK